MDPATGGPGQGDVPGHHDLLGHGRHARAGPAGSTRLPRAWRRWPASDLSSQCWARVTSRPRAYSKARRIRPADCTPAPSSVNSRTPSPAISAMGANRSPARSTVMAPATATSAVALAPSSSTLRTASAESRAGSVLGMATTAVNPPSGAARVPVSMVSDSSRPGWRRWVCRSTRPGATTQPPASSTVAPGRPGQAVLDRHHPAGLDQHVGPPLAVAGRSPCRPG